MKISDPKTLTLLAVFLATPAAASGFLVVAATGVVEPEGLQAGQVLQEKTRIGLEPWGRALIREAAGCGLTHLVAGLDEYVLTLTTDCSRAEPPLPVAQRVQAGEAFAALLEETGEGQADDLVRALANEPCVFLRRVSDEGDSRRQCPSGYALRGLKCTGPFCDDKDLLCCPYLEGAPDPSAKELQSRWISEEFPNVLQAKGFLNGLTCGGDYCDNLLPHQFKSSRLVNAKSCDWSVWSSERPAMWLDCSAGRLVAGIRCRDDYCGDVGLRCCQARVE